MAPSSGQGRGESVECVITLAHLFDTRTSRGGDAGNRVLSRSTIAEFFNKNEFANVRLNRARAAAGLAEVLGTTEFIAASGSIGVSIRFPVDRTAGFCRDSGGG